MDCARREVVDLDIMNTTSPAALSVLIGSGAERDSLTVMCFVHDSSVHVAQQDELPVELWLKPLLIPTLGRMARSLHSTSGGHCERS